MRVAAAAAEAAAAVEDADEWAAKADIAERDLLKVGRLTPC